jgi:hypothetical protein
MVRRLLFALMLLPTAACPEHPYNHCSVELERYCHDYDLNPGRCLMSSMGYFCAFPDKRCPSGWRWAAIARGDLANTCVDQSVPLDAGIDASMDQLVSGG